MIKVFLLLFVHKKKFFLFVAFKDNFSFFAAWELPKRSKKTLIFLM